MPIYWDDASWLRGENLSARDFNLQQSFRTCCQKSRKAIVTTNPCIPSQYTRMYWSIPAIIPTKALCTTAKQNFWSSTWLGAAASSKPSLCETGDHSLSQRRAAGYTYKRGIDSASMKPGTSSVARLDDGRPITRSFRKLDLGSFSKHPSKVETLGF